MGRLNTAVVPSNPIEELKKMIDDPRTYNRFHPVLGDKTKSYLSNVLSIANNDKLLKTAEAKTILNASLQAAILDLPINQNFGFAYIVPFQNKKENKTLAQLQIGYKGYIQLAIRSNKYLKINVAPLYDGQFKRYDPIKDTLEYDLDNKKSDKITHFIGYFKLMNGFEKYLIMSVEEIDKHAKKYSQSYKKGFGVWRENFNAMAEKTVIKLLLSKYGILSTELEQALKTDQAVIVSSDKETNEANEVIYVDTDNQYNDFIPETKEAETIEEVEEVEVVEVVEEKEITEEIEDIEEIF